MNENLINGKPIEIGNVKHIKWLKESNLLKEARDRDFEEEPLGYLTADTDHECNCDNCPGGDYDVTAKFTCYYCGHKQSIHHTVVNEQKDEESALDFCQDDEIKCINCQKIHVYKLDGHNIDSGIFPLYYNKDETRIFNPNQLILELNGC